MENDFAIDESERDAKHDGGDRSEGFQPRTSPTPAGILPPSVTCNYAYSDEDSHSLLSLESAASESWMGVAGDERSYSSLSCVLPKSRIPRLSRSASLRERKHCRRSIEEPSATNNRPHNSTPIQEVQFQFGGLYRSASFATSRGLTGIQPKEQKHSLSTKLDAATSRRKTAVIVSSYVSPYSRKSIAAERRAQVSLTEHNLRLHQGSSKDRTDEDVDSEKSFGSDRSAASCDVGIFAKKSYCGAHRHPNVLHCRHTQDNNVDEYLTPTQRAVKKLRELRIQLKEAQKEIAERDSRIAALTKELVELRITKAENGIAIHTKDSPINPKPLPLKLHFDEEHLQRFSFSSTSRSVEVNKSNDDVMERKPSNGSSICDPRVTPSSDGSELELRILKDIETKGSAPLKDVVTLHSPGVLSLEDSESCDLSRSLADSGNYEGVPSPTLSTKDSLDSGRVAVRTVVQPLYTDDETRESSLVWSAIEAAESRVRADYDKRLEEHQRNHMNEYHELKEKHNDHVENLLAKLSDANLRYFEIRPLYEKAKEKIRELEKEKEKLREELRESELRHQKVFLQMYLKGQEAARIEAEEESAKGCASRNTSEETNSEEKKKSAETSKEDTFTDHRVIGNLMKQLTEAEEENIKLKALYHHEMARANRRSFSRRGDEIDPEITLQFLKSAIYYFLTDKDNSHGHLRAIESILGYSSTEKVNIRRNVNM